MLRFTINARSINKLMLGLMIAWYLLPIASNRMGTIGLIVIFGMWCLTGNIRGIFSCIKYKPYAWFLVWYTYMLLVFLLGFYTGGEPIYFFTMTFVFSLPLVLFRYYTTVKQNLDLLLLVQKIVISLLIIAAINTISVLIQYPLAAKILAMAGAQETEKQIYSAMGCGGYNYIYCLGVGLVPIYFSKNRLNRFWKVLKIVAIILSMVAMVLSQYTLSLMILAICFVICVALKMSENGKIGRAGVVIFIVAGMLLSGFLPAVLEYISKLFSNNSGLSTRIKQISAFLNTGEQGYDLGSRITLYGDSWGSFISNPILGVGVWGNGVIGNHSSLLDQLGRYGLIGTLPYVLFCVTSYNYSTCCCNKRIMIATYLAFLILSTINTTIYVYPIGMMLLFVVPVFAYNYDSDLNT